MGAWIETWLKCLQIYDYPVAPRVGAWIETSASDAVSVNGASLPVWERGLKLPDAHEDGR